MMVRDRMSTPAVTVQPGMDYRRALELMDKHRLHHLPVVDDDGALVGVVAERDLLIAAAHYLNSAVDIAEVMTRKVFSVTPGTPITLAARMMVSHQIGGLPVIDDGNVVGVITETDIFRAFVEGGPAG